MTSDRNWRIISEVSDLPANIDEAIRDTLAWYEDRKTVPAEDFIDKLCKSYGGNGYGADDWDMDSYDSPAAREILRRARRLKKEQEQWG